MNRLVYPSVLVALAGCATESEVLDATICPVVSTTDLGLNDPSSMGPSGQDLVDAFRTRTLTGAFVSDHPDVDSSLRIETSIDLSVEPLGGAVEEVRELTIPDPMGDCDGFVGRVLEVPVEVTIESGLFSSRRVAGWLQLNESDDAAAGRLGHDVLDVTDATAFQGVVGPCVEGDTVRSYYLTMIGLISADSAEFFVGQSIDADAGRCSSRRLAWEPAAE